MYEEQKRNKQRIKKHLKPLKFRFARSKPLRLKTPLARRLTSQPNSLNQWPRRFQATHSGCLAIEIYSTRSRLDSKRLFAFCHM